MVLHPPSLVEFDEALGVGSALPIPFKVEEGTAARPEPITKRLFDICLSAFGLLCSSPLWLVIAVTIKLEDGGPIFFIRERVGKGGRHFRSFKFRSMIVGADRMYGPMQARCGDLRMTRVGRLLRATALDELPQLLNIFLGEMSFVGPRALLSAEIEVNGNGKPIRLDEIAGYAERQSVRPGLTGVAQVYAPRDVPRKEKFKYDLLYIRQQSFWLDAKLIFLSFWISLRAKWESREKKF